MLSQLTTTGTVHAENFHSNSCTKKTEHKKSWMPCVKVIIIYQQFVMNIGLGMSNQQNI